MFKKFSLWAAAFAFTVSIFSVVTLGSLNILTQPGQLKGWGAKSGAYEKLPKLLIDQVAFKQSSGQNKDAGLGFSDPSVQAAAKSALTPEFVQKSAEQIIDESFDWLTKKSAQPEYAIDLLSVKQNFADNLGVRLKERYEALPFCAAGTTPQTTDLLKIDCRPDDDLFDIDQALDSQKLKILESKDFLPETTISANTSSDSSLYRRTIAPQIFGIFRLAPAVFAGLALLAGILVVVLCDSKKFGLRKLGWRFVVAGILALLATVAGFFALAEVRQLATSQSAESGITAYKDIVSAIINVARMDLIKVSGALSLGSIVLGGVILASTLSVSRKNQPKTDKPLKQDTEDQQERPLPIELTYDEPDEPEAPSAPPLPAAPKPRPPKRNLIQ